MEQILVTIDDTQSLSSVRNAIKMLRGVVSASIVKKVQTNSDEEAQQTYVKDSLTRAIREVRLAKLEGKTLQSADDFIKEMRES